MLLFFKKGVCVLTKGVCVLPVTLTRSRTLTLNLFVFLNLNILLPVFCLHYYLTLANLLRV